MSMILIVAQAEPINQNWAQTGILTCDKLRTGIYSFNTFESPTYPFRYDRVLSNGKNLSVIFGLENNKVIWLSV